MCGIFGIVNHHKRQLDKRAFITLGCANDARGGDACGIMIDRQVERGTDGYDKYFQNWYVGSELLEKTEKCYVAFGHCRKASVGGTTPDKAQPITIHDKDGKMLFCLIHNGTIYNYKELADKYIPDIKIAGLSDSQVMAYIFFYKGYDVLAEYNGGGAFVIQDYRTNKTLLFRGESIGSYNAKKPEAERPLYFVKTGKSVIFSSIYAVLQGLYWGFTTYDVPSNVLLECDGQTLYKVHEYDRTNCKGYRAYTVVTTPKTNTEDEYGGWYGGSYGYYGAPVKLDFDVVTGTYSNVHTHELLHGIVYISPTGYISKYSTTYNHPYYFWNGIMLSGENAYNAIRDCHAAKMPSGDLMNLARRLSCNPVAINKKYITYSADNKKAYYEDEYEFPLTKIGIICNKHGKIMIQYDTDEIQNFIPVTLPKEAVNKIVDYVKKSIQ